MSIASWAQAEAERLLGDADDRWRHIEGVATRADQVGAVVPAGDRPVLAAAAWLHDVGDAPDLQRTGLQALDGALWLRGQGEERLAGLVAYHSGASTEAELLGIDDQLSAFVDEASPVTDALWYCDLTTGPQGERMSLAERVAEVEHRHGRDSIVARAMRMNMNRFEACVTRITELVRLAAVSR